MTDTDTGNHRGWVGVLAGGAIAAGLMMAVGAPTAAAAPADPAAQTDAPAPDPQQPQTADQALALIAKEYDTGAGGGQISNLIHQVLQLRAKGIPASKANGEALIKALDYRPNQGPLVRALQETLSYQQKKLNQVTEPSNPFTIGINQYDPENPGVLGTFGISPGG